MKRTLLLLFLMPLFITANAQDRYVAIADSALSLIGHNEDYQSKEQLSGKVKSYEIQMKFADETDYLAQLLLFYEWGIKNMPHDKKPSAPVPKDKYLPVFAMNFDLSGQPLTSKIWFPGQPPVTSDRIMRRVRSRDSAYRFRFSGDTVIASTIEDADPLPWIIIRFLKNGQLLSLKSKAESDVVFYEDHLFSYPGRGKTIITHYTQEVVYDENNEATYLPDTPGVTLRNKYKPDAPDVHALRRTALVGRVELITTDSGYIRNYYKEAAEEPSAYAIVNAKGLITEATFRYYSTAVMRNKFTYDIEGNWIKREISLPYEKEQIRFSPVIRKITYY